MKTLRFLIYLAVLALPTLGLFGCVKEHDPHEKIDAPGYYNGPMKPHGGNAPETPAKTTDN